MSAISYHFQHGHGFAACCSILLNAALLGLDAPAVPVVTCYGEFLNDTAGGELRKLSRSVVGGHAGKLDKLARCQPVGKGRKDGENELFDPASPRRLLAGQLAIACPLQPRGSWPTRQVSLQHGELKPKWPDCSAPKRNML